MGVDHRYRQDWAADQAEERRKADMMEAWYEIQRIEARGLLYPQPMCERPFGYGMYLNQVIAVDRQIQEYVDNLRKDAELLSGARFTLGLDLGTEDKK